MFQAIWTEPVPSARLLAPPLPPFLRPLLAPDFRDDIPDTLRGGCRFLQCAFAERLEAVTALGPAAAFGRRIGEPGPDKALVLQPVQRDVDRAERDGPRPGKFSHFGVNRDAISVIPQAQNRSENQLLELTERFGLLHFPNIVRQIDSASQ